MRMLLGITGASGSPYALKAMEVLAQMGLDVSICATKTGERVFAHETGKNLLAVTKSLGLEQYDNDDLFAPVASGSHPLDAMLVLPCSMSTLGEIAHACGKGLLARSADVCLKERRRLVLAVRETPLHVIHLQNMTAVAQAGGIILPCTPGFYHPMETVTDVIDFVVGRALHTVGVPNTLYKQWGGTAD